MAGDQRQRLKGRSTDDGKHTRLYRWLTRSPAWRSLKPAERCVYLELAERFNGSNNGRISMSLRELEERVGVSKATASRALSVLVDRGFIVQTKEGSFRRKVRHASEWRLTEHPTESGPATKEFVRWSGGGRAMQAA